MHLKRRKWRYLSSKITSNNNPNSCISFLKLFKANNEIKIIGTRHGEKLYESLLSREEILRAKETERHFVIPLDDRGLNYNSYFAEGSIDLASLSDYTSHNAKDLELKK